MTWHKAMHMAIARRIYSLSDGRGNQISLLLHCGNDLPSSTICVNASCPSDGDARSMCWTLPPFTRYWVGPVWPLPGAVLQARPPPGAVSNHAVDGGFEPEPSAPEASQHSAIPPTVASAASTVVLRPYS